MPRSAECSRSTSPSSAARRTTRAVRLLLAGGLVEAVGVGAEVQQRERAVHGGRGAQLGERDGVVPAEAQRHGACFVHRSEELLHGGQAPVAEAGHHVGVAGVDRREALEHGDPLRRVVGRVDGERRLADRTGAEPGARAHGEPRVERQADHGDVDVVEARDVRQTQERGHAGHARRLRPVGGTVSLHDHLLPGRETTGASVPPLARHARANHFAVGTDRLCALAHDTSTCLRPRGERRDAG